MPHVPRLLARDTTLLIVDVQEKLMPVIHDGEIVIKNCSILAQMARRLNLPVVVTEQYPQKLGVTTEPVRRALEAYQPISKMRFSGWTTETQIEVEKHQRRTLLLCGVEAHICALQSTLDVIEAGYTVFVAYDAVSSRQPSNKQVGWERMLSAGAIPTSTESALFELLDVAGTDDFRALQPLIK